MFIRSNHQRQSYFEELDDSSQNTENTQNSQTLEADQSSSFQESFSNLINVESEKILDTNLSQYVRENHKINYQNSSDLNDFINGNFESKSQNSIVEFLYSVENNENSSLSSENAISVINYKNKIIDNKFENLKSKLNAFSNIKNNNLFLKDTFLKKF